MQILGYTVKVSPERLCRDRHRSRSLVAPCVPLTQAPAEMHIVHSSADGKLLVVGVLLALSGSDNPTLATFWYDDSLTRLTVPRLDWRVTALHRLVP